MKAFLAAILAFLATLKAPLAILFGPAELGKAFAASASASTLVGFAVAFLSTIGTDASANPSAGIAGAVVSFALLQVAAKLKALSQAKDFLSRELAHVAKNTVPSGFRLETYPTKSGTFFSYREAKATGSEEPPSVNAAIEATPIEELASDPKIPGTPDLRARSFGDLLAGVQAGFISVPDARAASGVPSSAPAPSNSPAPAPAPPTSPVLASEPSSPGGGKLLSGN